MSTAMDRANLGLIPTHMCGDNAAVFHNVSVRQPDLAVVDDDSDNELILRQRGTRNGVLVNGFGHLSDDGTYYRKVVLSFEPLHAVH